MDEKNKIRKQRYFEKTYREAKDVPCACGCGTIIKNKDRYGRDKKYENGHNGRKYADPKQYKKEYHAKIKRQKAETKEWLIKELGGKCCICEYEFDGRNHAAFDFHHRDSDEKDFNISKVATNKQAKEKILKEAKKCDLICAVCHRLTHSGYFD